jgi:hypothetical protein
VFLLNLLLFVERPLKGSAPDGIKKNGYIGETLWEATWFSNKSTGRVM